MRYEVFCWSLGTKSKKKSLLFHKPFCRSCKLHYKTLQEEPQEDPRARFWRDVDNSLSPLLCIFISILNLKDFMDIVSEMRVNENLTAGMN